MQPKVIVEVHNTKMYHLQSQCPCTPLCRQGCFSGCTATVMCGTMCREIQTQPVPFISVAAVGCGWACNNVKGRHYAEEQTTECVHMGTVVPACVLLVAWCVPES
eukprot:TRINITY_DN3788_c0_g1_i1.p2 TRINITY_DN3788_c0_g1~~TRINITY_DN3788_c0_g1_i1.p2  ORF type:complete len:105 (-),score=1.73 TRINITY_DN3788_c0_g1_i1:358-672(-)